MSAIAPLRHTDYRHLAFTLSVTGLSAMLVWTLAGFLKPHGFVAPIPDVVLVGRVDDFAPDSVNTFREQRFHLMRLEDGNFLALSMRGYRGCTTAWRENAYVHDKLGAFIEPCSGVAYDKTGSVISVPTIAGSSRLVAGPDLRGLDQHRVELRGDEVWVHTHDAIPGLPAPDTR